MRLAALLLASLVASGCLAAATRIPPGGPAATTPDGWPATGGRFSDGALELRLDPAATQAGARVTFLVTLVVHEPLRATHRGCGPGLLDAWIDVDGTRVWLDDPAQEPLVGACAWSEVVLEPGRHARLASWDGRVAGVPAPPGAYAVHARTGLVDRDLAAVATVVVPDQPAQA